MVKPIVAIIGRPNVGKSTLFNRIVGKRIAIVEDKPGITRDRIYADAEWLKYNFTVIDTGGIETGKKDTIIEQTKAQAEIAIETADVILFMVDARDGVVAADEEIADRLRKTFKPVILVVNKVDTKEVMDNIYSFYGLGLGEPIAISASQGLNIGDLLDETVKHFGNIKEDYVEDEDAIKIALIGRPNVGKSSILNSILGEERVIVSDIPGTTRDAVDTVFELDGERFAFIDTAGIRKKSRVSESIEYYSVLRALKAIERSDVVLMILDAVEGVTEQDKKIVGYAHEAGRAIILVVNKWDLVKKDHRTMDNYRKVIRNEMPFIQYAPILFVSAKTRQRINRIIDLVKFAADQYSMRIQTGNLNRFLDDITAMVEPPSDRGRKLKIYYITQPKTKPPTFLLFVNDPQLMHFSYKRYIENQLRASFGLEATPIKILVRKR